MALGEVLFSVVECGDGDVSGDVIEGEDELFVLGEFCLELGWNEPVVELCAGGFECVEVAVGIADRNFTIVHVLGNTIAVLGEGLGDHF